MTALQDSANDNAECGARHAALACQEFCRGCPGRMLGARDRQAVRFVNTVLTGIIPAMEAKLKRRQVIDLTALSGCGEAQPPIPTFADGSRTSAIRPKASWARRRAKASSALSLRASVLLQKD
jgi:hypothetical protein